MTNDAFYIGLECCGAEKCNEPSAQFSSSSSLAPTAWAGVLAAVAVVGWFVQI
eukprot:CAMPEP_0184296982 /NCGR_PEP_ID=MMETSP1049-20130417/7924_1 /TAXON_ID=77928 /ORGANISM="Proteomonas sulcata, Strain CCMP704" /LENGTH=52 /DNA_ID=CAMNT_0026606491 /DNA_START=515 /DNA_END=673 /DNA_ORIENTATION=+